MKAMRKPLTVLILAAAAGAGYAGFDLVENAQFARAEQRVEATREQLSSVNDQAAVFKSVNKVLEPSVVSIEVTKTVRNAGPINIPEQLRPFIDPDGDGSPDIEGFGDRGPQIQHGTGSGVIIETDGDTAYIVTNNHVAGEASEMTITLADGRTITNGKLLGADPKTDLAVIKVTIERVIPAKWGDSSTLGKGDWVLAFGSPLGYVGSMTHGIVSALDRQSNPNGGEGVLGRGGYENFIQVDCPINPGNSGGPLVNVSAEVVGINTAIASRTGGFQGIGFAIPSNQAKAIYEQLKSNGKVTRGWLGVGIADVGRTRKQAEAAGYKGENGVYVSETFRDTPAYGKLQPDDVITSIDGKKVRTSQELRNQIAVTAPGTELKLGVVRNGKDVEVPIKVGSQPDDASMARLGRPGADRDDARPGAPGAVGLRLVDPTDEQRERFGLDESKEGALVTAVSPRSPAALVGLRPGDLITRINATSVKSADEAQDALAAADKSKDLRLLVTNRDGSRLVFIPAELFERQGNR